MSNEIINLKLLNDIRKLIDESIWKGIFAF